MSKDDEILDEIKRLHTRVGECTDSVTLLTTAITGSIDGSVKGLNQRVAETEQEIHSLESKEADRRKITVGAIIAAGGGAASAIWQIITKHIGQ